VRHRNHQLIGAHSWSSRLRRQWRAARDRLAQGRLCQQPGPRLPADESFPSAEGTGLVVLCDMRIVRSSPALAGRRGGALPPHSSPAARAAEPPIAIAGHSDVVAWRELLEDNDNPHHWPLSRNDESHDVNPGRPAGYSVDRGNTFSRRHRVGSNSTPCIESGASGKPPPDLTGYSG